MVRKEREREPHRMQRGGGMVHDCERKAKNRKRMTVFAQMGKKRNTAVLKRKETKKKTASKLGGLYNGYCASAMFVRAGSMTYMRKSGPKENEKISMFM